MIKRPLVVLMLGLAVGLQAQRITKYEYWFDSDVGARVTGTPQGNDISLSVNVGELKDGIHTFNFRAVDDKNRWSSPMAQYFLCYRNTFQGPNRITDIEYWIDHNVGQRVSAATDGNVALDIDVKSLADGIHTLSYRFKDARGQWSSPMANYFLKTKDRAAARLTRYEYWIDRDVENKVSVQTSDGIVQLDIDVDHLAQGIHTLTFRMEDANGCWSAPLCRYFMKSSALADNKIVGYQYWFNDDFGAAEYVKLPAPEAKLLLEVDLPVSGAYREVTPENIAQVATADGTWQIGTKNRLYVRFRDTNGRWSALQADTFTTVVEGTNLDLTAFIVNPRASEQWTGWTATGTKQIADYGHWSGTADPYFRLGNTASASWTAVMEQTISGLPAGTYCLTALGRAASGAVLEMSVGGYGVAFVSAGDTGGELWEQAPDGSAEKAANGGLGCGWGRQNLVFTTTGEPFTLQVKAAAQAAGQWADIDDMALYTVDVNSLDEAEWQLLGNIRDRLVAGGWTTPWDMSYGIGGAGMLRGVGIERGHIVSLDLSDQGLSGAFPADVLRLPYLKRLSLARNNLSGNPVEVIRQAVGTSRQLPLESLDISANMFSGDVGQMGELARQLSVLKTLRAGGNRFEAVGEPLPETITTLDLNGQSIDGVVKVDVSNLDFGELLQHMPSLMLYDHGNQTYNTATALRIANYPPTAAASDYQGDKPYWGIEIDELATGRTVLRSLSAEKLYRGASGDTLYLSYPYASAGVAQSYCGAAMMFGQGDVNFVNGVDASDLQATILYAFGGYRSNQFNFTAADTYVDDNINVQDVVCTVNILLGQQSAGTAMNVARQQAAGDVGEQAAEAYVYISNGRVILDSERPVAAIDVKAMGDIEWNVGAYGLTQSVQGGNLVGYSLSGATLPAGPVVIGTCTGGAAQIRHISLADEDANAINAVIGEGSTTGIGGISTCADDDTRIYNVAGMRQESLKKGINILRTNGRYVKIKKGK